MAKLLRETKQRNAIKRVFTDENRPLSPKEVIMLASREVPNIGIATIYRNIKALVEEKELTTVEIPGQSPRYCLKENRKQALFVCAESDQVFFLPDEAVEIKVRDMPQGYCVHHSEVILYGNSTPRS